MYTCQDGSCGVFVRHLRIMPFYVYSAIYQVFFFEDKTRVSGWLTFNIIHGYFLSHFGYSESLQDIISNVHIIFNYKLTHFNTNQWL